MHVRRICHCQPAQLRHAVSCTLSYACVGAQWAEAAAGDPSLMFGRVMWICVRAGAGAGGEGGEAAETAAAIAGIFRPRESAGFGTFKNRPLYVKLELLLDLIFRWGWLCVLLCVCVIMCAVGAAAYGLHQRGMCVRVQHVCVCKLRTVV